MTNGMPFYAYNGINTAQLVDGHFKNIYIHRTGEKSTDKQMSLYSTISDISTLAHDSAYWIDNVSTFIRYNPTSIEIENCDYINCNNASFGSIELDNMIRLDSGQSEVGFYVYDTEYNAVANAHFANVILHQDGDTAGVSKNIWEILQWIDDVSRGWLDDTSLNLDYVITKNGSDVSIRGRDVIVDGGQISLKTAGGRYIDLKPNGDESLEIKRYDYDKGRYIDANFSCGDLIANGRVQAEAVYIKTGSGQSVELKEYLNSTYTDVTNLITENTKLKADIKKNTDDIVAIKNKINDIINETTTTPFPIS